MTKEARERYEAERRITSVMSVEDAIQTQSQSRYYHGLQKYGITLDRDDLSPMDWLQHFKEEMMDGIRYCEKLQREIENGNLKAS
jgi:hypothetical protein